VWCYVLGWPRPERLVKDSHMAQALIESLRDNSCAVLRRKCPHATLLTIFGAAHLILQYKSGMETSKIHRGVQTHQTSA